MKRTTLYIAIALIVLGFIGNFYGNRASYVSADGMLHDSIWLPIGSLMLFIGVILLLVWGALSGISYLKNRRN